MLEGAIRQPAHGVVVFPSEQRLEQSTAPARGGPTTSLTALVVAGAWFSTVFASRGAASDAVLLAAIAPAAMRTALSLRRIRIDIVQAGLIYLLTLYTLSSMASPSSEAMKHTIGFACSFFVYTLFREHAEKQTSRSMPRRVSLFCTLGTAIVALFGSNLGKNAASGLVVYSLLLALALTKSGQTSSRRVAAGALLLAAVAFLLDHRTMVLLGLVLAVEVLLLSRFEGQGAARLTGIATVAAAALLVVVVASIGGDSRLADLDREVTEVSGRTVQSGRQVLWPAIIDSIADEPVFGIGPGGLARDVTELKLSAHNYFLQVGLQLGLPALFGAFFLFYALWRKMSKLANQSSRALGQAVVLLVFFHSIVEVFLTQNLLGVGVVAWAALGTIVGGDR